MRTLVIDEDAREEIRQAADYYDRQRPGLGTRFEVDLLRTRISILDNPFQFAEEEDGFHYAVLDVFPYSLIYHVNETRILVLAAAHHKRRPGYWHERIRR